MSKQYRIVVSAENKPGHAWQCKLFYFSSIIHLRQQPTFVVHASGEPWHSDFYDLVRAGALVHTAPSYISKNALATRNFPGSLLHAATVCNQDDIIVLCDPDMIFVRQPEFSRNLSCNYYSYLNYNQPHVLTAAERLGVSREALLERQPELVGGVPYLVPAGSAAQLGAEWLEAIDVFSRQNRDVNSIWLDVMYAFGLAVTKLGWKLELMDRVNMNFPTSAILDREIIHYCLGDDQWNKRVYYSAEDAHKVWNPSFEPAVGSVLHEVFSQLRQTAAFYNDPYFLGAKATNCWLGSRIVRSIAAE